MNMPLPETFTTLQPVIDVATQAGGILLSKWPGAVSGQLDIEQKSDGSFVTEADFASNELIVSTLTSLYREDGIVSEELKPDENVAALSTAWIIDPLDGTQSFIDGKDDFSILIARVHERRVVDAVMHFPALDIMAVARRGAGAFINGTRISVAASQSLRKQSVYIRNFICEKQEFAYPDHMDSGRAFLAVARGEIDAAVMRMGRHQEWDLAAPSLLIEEAGGSVSDEDDTVITYNNKTISYNYFLASNKTIHAELHGLIPK